VFFGSSTFAIPALLALAAQHDIVAVVTQPDRPAGRGLALRSTPVMLCAREAGLPVLAPARLDPEFVAKIAAERPRILACASYGRILPRALIEMPGSTALNVHPSLLPEYRGATPIQTALRDGRTRTGVTVFWMTDEMDAGDIALQEEVEIGPLDDYGALHGRLAEVGARLLLSCAAKLAAGTLARTPQDRSRATFTKPIEKKDLQIRTEDSAKRIVDLVRSASPSPGAWTIFGARRLKVLQARAELPDAPSLSADGPSIQASDGRVRLLRVVPEGKRAMSGDQFARSIALER
jgi:methionyl-tRNA formyltransferase